MRDLLKHAVRKIKSTSHRIRWELRQRSPTEKEFKQIWSSVASIEGLLVSPDQERWFFTTARSLPDRAVIVEIGSFKGRSTCCFAYGCRGTTKRIFANII